MNVGTSEARTRDGNGSPELWVGLCMGGSEDYSGQPSGACARCPYYLQAKLVGGNDDEEHPEDSLGEVVELERQEEVGEEDRQGDGG